VSASLLRKVNHQGEPWRRIKAYSKEGENESWAIVPLPGGYDGRAILTE